MKPGCMAWLRAWYGLPVKRGASVRIGGRRAMVLSASGGFVNVRVWNTGQRLTVRPTDLSFA